MGSPLRVRWLLGGQMVVPRHLLLLDGLLAWAAADEAISQGRDPEKAVLELPLERYVAADGSWVWKASQLQFTPLSSPVLHPFVRRTDLDTIALDRDQVFESPRRINSVSIGSGKLKAYSLTHLVQQVLEASAWCIGDEARIRELLGRVTALGKVTRNGYGRVRSFEIERCEDVDRWMRRPLPVGTQVDGVQMARAIGRLVPPYWAHPQVELLEPVQ